MIHVRRITAHHFKQLEQVDLLLPREGRFLVRGPNEAGKSTLFEAIYCGLFGRPLTTETSYARLDDVIRYGAEEAWLRLELELAAGRRMVLTRRVRRDRPNEWHLDMVGPDGVLEEVRGNRVVNQRVEEELGFDGEALLNTCFVEQKKLEKLEGMSRSQREQSLMRLLNLDRLVELEGEFKVSGRDRERLRRLEGRLTLARRQAELPALEEKHATAVAALARVEALRALEAAVEETRTREALAAKLEAARAKEKALGERAAKAERLREARGALREARTARDRAREAAAAAAGLAEELAAARAAEAERIPAVVERGKRLRRLKRRLECLARLRAERETLVEAVSTADERLTALAEQREELNTVRQRLVEARAAAREAARAVEAQGNLLRAFEVRAALHEWAAARTALDELAAGADELATAEAAREDELRALWRRLGVEAAALIVLALAVGYVVQPAVGLVAALVLLGWRLWSALRRRERLSQRLYRLQGEVAVRDREMETQRRRAEAVEERLDALNVVRPADPERARTAIAELDERLDGRERSEIEGALEEARQRGAQAAATVEQLEPREAALREAAGRVDAAALGRRRDEQAARMARIERFLERRGPQVMALAEELAAEPDPAAVEYELGGLRHELKELRGQAARAPELEREHAAREAAAERHVAAAAQVWSQLPAVDGLPTWSEDLTDEAWDAAAAALSAAYAAAGGDDVRRALEAATREAAGLAGQLKTTEAGLAETLRRLRERLAASALELALPADPSRADLDAARDAVAPQAEGDVEARRAEVERLTQRLNVVRHERDRLARELGLAGEVLDVEQAERAYERARRQLAVRERAAEIVSQAGRSVVQRVLPSTIEHMRQLLPRLTEGRYFDARLSEDYTIEVYDEQAEAFKRKNIFSGGTRDQLSLALRLAFALATLPEERGTAPSFLFLDEPLGAFDSARAAALIGLLTEGELAESFDQIFLISHVRVDPQLFDYRVTLEGGRVVETNLPPAADDPFAGVVEPELEEAVG